MTHEEMLKTSWKPYMLIHYEPEHGSELCHEMTLIGIEFDDEAVHCVPSNSDDYEHEEFYINIRFIKLPKNNKDTMRTITTNAPKINAKMSDADRSRWHWFKNDKLKPSEPISKSKSQEKN